MQLGQDFALVVITVEYPPPPQPKFEIWPGLGTLVLTTVESPLEIWSGLGTLVFTTVEFPPPEN